MVRSQLAKDALALEKRVDKIAEGAALMTETSVKKRFIDGCSNTVPNKVLETLLWKNFNEVGVPTYTKEEEEYAKAIISSYEMTNDDLPGDACDESEEIAAWVDKVSQHATIQMCIRDRLCPDRGYSGSMISVAKTPGSFLRLINPPYFSTVLLIRLSPCP